MVAGSKTLRHSGMILTKRPSGRVWLPRMWMTPSRVKPRSMAGLAGCGGMEARSSGAVRSGRDGGLAMRGEGSRRAGAGGASTFAG